jgi:O-acetyl-ADP-ribose deacetylase (regulator of RNase III)
MFTVIYGDVLSHPTGLIVHGCNCQGIMGGGVALQVRQQFPTVYQAYMAAHSLEELYLGNVIPVEVAPFKIIVNAMTQIDCTGRRDVDYEAIAKVFEKVVAMVRVIAVTTGRTLPIVFPQIGAGIAGGDWEIIKVIIDRTIPDDIEAILYMYKP